MSRRPAHRRQRLRAAWLRGHRWLGLGLGLWLVLLGLTGSALVFYRGLDEWADPRLAPGPASLPMPRMESVYQALRQAHPQRGPGWRIELPRAPGEAITARWLKPAETAGEHFAPLLATVDPTGQRVVANRFWGRHLGTWLYDLHYSLLLGEVGHQAVGWAGVALLASLISGAWLWWPATGAWRRALHFKRHAAPARRVYDLHKLGGLASLPLLGVLAFTGALLALPHLARPAVSALSPLTPLPTVLAPALPGPVPGRLRLDDALQQARRLWPEAEPRWVDMPATPGAPYRLRVRRPGEPGDRFPDSWLWLDSRTGAELARRDTATLGAGDAFWRWLHPLHSGHAFGLPGRWLVFVSGALPLLLAATGWLRWRTKRRLQAGRGRGGTPAAP